MYNFKYVFALIVVSFNKSKFKRIIQKYEGDKYVKHFTCWNQLLAMMFGQLCFHLSLRDLISILEAQSSKCNHLGLGRNFSKTNLAYANQNVIAQSLKSLHIIILYEKLAINVKRIYLT